MSLPGLEAGSQEMQLMVGPAGATVRDVGLVDAPGRSSDASYVDFGRVEEDGASLLKRARWRVLVLSGLFAAYAVVGTAAESAIDAAEISTIVEKVKGVGAGHLDVVSILTRCAPWVGMDLLLALLVSACGFCGAKQGQRRAVGCFSCCNALCGCCSCCAMTALLLCLAMAGSTSSALEAFMERCDPQRCVPAAQGGLHPANLTCVTDCLAAGLWEDYSRRCHGPAYPKTCPKAFLVCKREGEHAEISSRRLDDDHAFRGFPMQQQRRPHPGRRSHRDSPWATLPRPLNPLRECMPRLHDMEKFHRVQKVLPDLWPRFMLLVTSEAVIGLIWTILMCTGAKWGWDLYQELGLQCLEGALGMQPALPLAAVQPASAAPFGEETLDRSLMLSLPPAPLTL